MSDFHAIVLLGTLLLMVFGLFLMYDTYCKYNELMKRRK